MQKTPQKVRRLSSNSDQSVGGSSVGETSPGGASSLCKPIISTSRTARDALLPPSGVSIFPKQVLKEQVSGHPRAGTPETKRSESTAGGILLFRRGIKNTGCCLHGGPSEHHVLGLVDGNADPGLGVRHRQEMLAGTLRPRGSARREREEREERGWTRTRRRAGGLFTFISSASAYWRARW